MAAPSPRARELGSYGFELTESCRACSFRLNGFFCQLSPSELTDFDEIKHVSGYPAGAILFFEQQRSLGVYLLCEGRVKLSFSSREGKTLILRIAKSGELLGLSSGLSRGPFEVTAETMQPCQVAFVSSDDFDQFLGRHPSLLKPLAADLSWQYKAACKQLRAVAFGASVSERLATFLLNWPIDESGPKDLTRFTLSLTHEEIGEHIGTSRESVTRALSELRSQGLIKTLDSTFVIPDRTALRKFRPAQNGPSTPRSGFRGPL